MFRRPGMNRAAARSISSSATKAMMLRTQLKVNGPMYSALMLWAENPKPQISAASRAREFCLILLFTLVLLSVLTAS